MYAYATLGKPEFSVAVGNVSAVADGRTLVDIRGVRFFAMENDKAKGKDGLPCHVDWKPDIEYMPSLHGLLESSLEDSSDLQLIEQMTMLNILRVYRSIKDILPKDSHTIKHKNWLAARIIDFKSGKCPGIPQALHWMGLSPEEQDSLYEALSIDFVSRKSFFSAQQHFMQSVFNRMVDIYEGSASPLEAMLEDDGWYKFHANRRWPSLKPFLSPFGHSRPAMKILEIGAGTGALTMKILEGLHVPDGRRMYSEYHFTDVSPSFFAAAKERLAQYSNLTFKALDITADPLAQGFDAAAYDMIICDNVSSFLFHIDPSIYPMSQRLITTRFFMQLRL
jgi:hypothetical protein